MWRVGSDSVQAMKVLPLLCAIGVLRVGIGMPLDSTFLTVPSGGRRLLQTCSAGSFAANGSCYNCPSGATSAVGSLSYSACTCPLPTVLSAYDVLAGSAQAYGPAVSYGTNKIHLIRNPYIGAGRTLVSWTVTTTGSCTIIPFTTYPGNDADYTNAANSQQNYYINAYSTPVTVPGAGTFTYAWNSVYGPNDVSRMTLMSFGWYTTDTNCVASTTTAPTQLLTIFDPMTSPGPWYSNTNQYFGAYKTNSYDGKWALQLNVVPSANPSSLSCNNCSLNSYYVSNTVCASCPVNSSSPAGSPGISSCTCSDPNMLMNNNQCVCRANFYLLSGSCLACNSSFISPINSTSVSQCVCPSGKSNVGGVCVCPSGLYFNSVSCVACPAGSFCVPYSSNLPTSCPANSYCPAGSTAATLCPTGQMSSAGSSDISQCQTAYINVNISIDGVSNSLSQSQFQNALPSNVAVQSYVDEIIVSQGVCPQGYYCPYGTTTPTPCPAGTYNNITNTVDSSTCLTCPQGNYCPLASILPTKCAAGSYMINLNAIQQSDCTVCPTGNYCPLGSISPTNCSAGTYNKYVNSTSANNCLSCPPGDYCPGATTTPSLCSANTFSLSSAPNCSVCPTYSTSPIASANCTCGAGHTQTVTTSGGGGGAAVSYTVVGVSSYQQISALSSLFVSPVIAALTINGYTNITAVQGTVLTLTSAAYSGSQFNMYIYSDVSGGVDASQLVKRSTLDGTYHGNQVVDFLKIEMFNTPVIYSTGLTGSGTPVVVWDTTNAAPGLYYLGTPSGIGLNNAQTYLEVFIASPVPTTISYTLGGKSSVMTSLGDTAQLSFSQSFWIWCDSLSDTAGTAGTMIQGGSSVGANIVINFNTASVNTATTFCYAGDSLGTTVYAGIFIGPRLSLSTSGGGGRSAVSYTVVGASSYRTSSVGMAIPSPAISILTINGFSNITAVKGTILTLTSTPFGGSAINMYIYSQLPNSNYDAQPLYRSDLDVTYTGNQIYDFVSLTTMNAAPPGYTTGITGTGTASLVWDTTNAAPGMYYLASPRTKGSFAIQSYLTIFIASPIPATFTFPNPAAISGGVVIMMANVGDSLVLQTNSPDNIVYVTCGSISDKTGALDVVVAQGAQPFTWNSAPINTATTFCNVNDNTAQLVSVIFLYPRPAAISSSPAVSTLSCPNCTSGYYSNAGDSACTTCGLGYYSPPVSPSCTICPLGTMCNSTTTPAPIPCGLGAYQPATGASFCSTCPVNQYCPSTTTYAPGSCPAHTASVAGSSSLLNCQCVPGFSCSYTKRITATVTLNTTLSSFNADLGGVQTAFKAAVAAAAGVVPSKVTINGVAQKAGARRLLAYTPHLIDVRTTIHGAERLRNLEGHLARHDATLHHSHTWEESHSLQTTSEKEKPRRRPGKF